MATAVETFSAELKSFGKEYGTRLKALETENKSLKDEMKKWAETPATKSFALPIDHDAKSRHDFSTPREFLTCVRKAETGGKVDKRLEGLRIKAAGSDEQTGTNDGYGGFLVPIGFSPDFLKIEPEADPIGSQTRKVPMDLPTIRIPARTDKDHRTSVSGGLTVTRRPETVAMTPSRMQVEQIELTAHSLHGISYATEEILRDSPQAFTSLLADGFNDEFTAHMVDERLNGSGVGEFRGIMDSPCTVTVDKRPGQAATSITYENVLDMRARCWKYSQAIWLANHDTMPDMMKLNQTLGIGGAIVWQPSAREDHPDMLLGRPLIFTEYTQTLGTKGDLVLGNWKEYLEGTYQPLESLESIHVRFVNHERAFKFWLRNAGIPWWRVPLTPKHSAQTLSPFVLLATRA